MEMDKGSWEAIVEGQIRDARKIQNLRTQVEKLSWMLEREIRDTNAYMDEEYGASKYTDAERIDARLDFLNDEWKIENAERMGMVSDAH